MSEKKDVKKHEKEEVQTPEGVERMSDRPVYLPKADIYETDDALTVVVDMPGVDENHIDITLEKNVLTLHGQIEPEAPEGMSLTYAEYDIGDYERAFTISDAIDKEKIEAAMADGVLTLTLPKAGPAKTKKIEVKAQ